MGPGNAAVDFKVGGSGGCPLPLDAGVSVLPEREERMRSTSYAAQRLRRLTRRQEAETSVSENKEAEFQLEFLTRNWQSLPPHARDTVLDLVEMYAERSPSRRGDGCA